MPNKSYVVLVTIPQGYDESVISQTAIEHFRIFDAVLVVPEGDSLSFATLYISDKVKIGGMYFLHKELEALLKSASTKNELEQRRSVKFGENYALERYRSWNLHFGEKLAPSKLYGDVERIMATLFEKDG